MSIMTENFSPPKTLAKYNSKNMLLDIGCRKSLSKTRLYFYNMLAFYYSQIKRSITLPNIVTQIIE